LRGPKGVRNVRGLEVDIPLMHLHRGMTARLHRHVHRDALPGPVGQGGIPEVVELELPDARPLKTFFYLLCRLTSRL
jgi:hypothetical protein